MPFAGTMGGFAAGAFWPITILLGFGTGVGHCADQIIQYKKK
jgi:hypothetical protein